MFVYGLLEKHPHLLHRGRTSEDHSIVHRSIIGVQLQIESYK
jgi:hypothetical protein